jgi:hypothetical protein
VTVRGSGLALGTARRCRFVLSPSVRVEVSATALFDGSGVVCVAPQTASAQPAPLEVTLNGVDWVGNVTHGYFTYTGSAAPDVIAPSSGPRHGGTSFFLGILPRPLSHMLASAGLAACRLGNDTHPATFDLQRGGLRCATPLLTPPAAVGEYPVYATINGQQFEPSPSATWRYVYSVQDLLSGNTASGGGASPSPPSAPPSAPPPLGTPGSGTADLTQVGSGLAGSGATGGSGPSSPSASATLRVGPLSGPAEGGTRLTLNASFALTLATELRCRFGHAAGGSVLATVAATSVFLGACVSPPLTAPGAIPLGLSLNGQQFYDFETFTSYAPAQPSTLTPLGAALDGGLEVALVGTSLGGGLGHRTCHFGAAVVPATYDASAPGGEVLRCRVPSADAVGLRTSLTLRFDDPMRFSELGSLHGQAALRGGALRLVPRAVPSGTPYPYSGALLLRVLAGAPPLPFWRVRFDMKMQGALSALGGGDGISLNYGPIGDGARLGPQRPRGERAHRPRPRARGASERLPPPVHVPRARAA